VDPVAPLVATGGAFLLATQLTYGQEKQERERNRILLGRFLAPQLLDELLRRDPERPLNLGGERRQVCVLFADMRNFTGFAETHTPNRSSRP
jgi:adenylate cyclase